MGLGNKQALESVISKGGHCPGKQWATGSGPGPCVLHALDKMNRAAIRELQQA